MSERTHEIGGAQQRVIVLAGWGFNGWALPGYSGEDQRFWIHGGERTLLELAAAAASAGALVELRGTFAEREVREIERLAAVTLGRPGRPRLATGADTVILPEGLTDPLLFGRVALSPARAVVLILAAPGLFGWAFDHGRPVQDATEVEPRSVGRPEQLAAARELGLEIWTNLRAIAVQAETLGIAHHYIGFGRPNAYPEVPTKHVDVVTVADNRWSALAREAVAGLRPGVSRLELPSMPREELLQGLGQARIFVHPARIEGRSRLAEEARAMATVPILLSSNHIVEGADAGSGGVAVDGVDMIAGAVHALLDEPERLQELSRAGHRSAREAGAWPAYVTRVADALASPDREVARFAAGRAALGASLAEREHRLLAALASVREQQAAAGVERERLLAALSSLECRYRALRRRRIVRAGLRVAHLAPKRRPRRTWT